VDAKGAPAQLRHAVGADATFLGRIAALTDAPRRDWRLDPFGAQQDLAAVLRLRLGCTRCTPRTASFRA
jgi:hypothetical protein